MDWHPKGREHSVMLQIRIPLALRTRLAAWCRKRGTDQSKAIRGWIEERLRRAAA